MMEGYPTIVQKRRSGVSSVAWGISTVLVTAILTGGSIAMYGLTILDRRTDGLFDSLGQAVRALPNLAEALPPALADLVSDQRRPDYANQIEASVRLAGPAEGMHGVRPVLEIRNRGSEVVSLLSMRIVVLNERGVPVASWNEWGATPIAADDCWRGPLLPGAARRFATEPGYRSVLHDEDDLRVELEITDVRVWTPAADQAPGAAEPPGDA